MITNNAQGAHTNGHKYLAQPISQSGSVPYGVQPPESGHIPV